MGKNSRSQLKRASKYRKHDDFAGCEAPPPPQRRESLPKTDPDDVPRPSTRKSSKNRRSSVNRKLSGQKTRSNIKSDEHEKSKNIKLKKIILAVLIALLVVLLGVLLYLFLPTYLSDECSNLNLPAEYRSIVCSRLQAGIVCTFDSSQCQVNCPLGYETDQYACIISCNCATNGVFESDVAYDQSTLQNILSAYMTEEDHTFQLFSGSATKVLSLWNRVKVGTSVRVPYVLSSNLDPSVVNGINKAINALSNETCIEFVLRTDQQDYIVFEGGLGCSSPVSRLGGEQHIVLSKECHSAGSVLHEMLHTLGFWHEHSRPDRDDHIMIVWRNIDKADKHQFNTRSVGSLFDFGSSYDKSSLMHGSGYSFSKDLTSPTMINIETDDVVKIQREKLSKEDVYETNALYECEIPFKGSTAIAQWGPWSKLGLCSVTCGSGTVYRLRECKNEKNVILPRRFCGTDYFQEESCDMLPCEMGLWGPWSPCDLTCGVGTRKRNSCCGSNSTMEVENCNNRNCPTPVAAFWADWEQWGECLRTCGNGLRRRYRACFDLFSAKIENLRCPQVGTSHLGIEICAPNACPKTAPISYWSVWSEWGECTRTCGVGTKKRFRRCLTINGTIAYQCAGDSMEVTHCNITQCPTLSLSLWTPWSPWSICTATCGGGQRQRGRTCKSSGELTIENDCGDSPELVDKEVRTETCRNEPCNPDKTMWGDWESWGECNRQCDGGMRWRLRLCFGGNYGHSECPWNGIYDKENCNEDPCTPVVRSVISKSGSFWGPWMQWAECTKSCDGGSTKRFRLCEKMQNAKPVLAFDCTVQTNSTSHKQTAVKNCNTQVCDDINATLSQWEPWSECTATCGRGIQKRKRTCHDGKICSEDSKHDFKYCLITECMGSRRKFGRERRSITDRHPSAKLTHSIDLRRMRKLHNVAFRKRSFCAEGRMILADFDGDNRKDVLCLDNHGRIKLQYRIRETRSMAADWDSVTNFCSDKGNLVFAVDFNNDGADDLMCYDKLAGAYVLMYSKSGKFEGNGDVRGSVDQQFCLSFDHMEFAVDLNEKGQVHPCRDF